MAAYYEIVVEQDEGTSGEKCFLVTVPAFPEITTDGDRSQDAIMNACNAIEEAIAARISHGEDIPVPVLEARKGRFYAEVSLLVLLKCSLYIICRKRNITRAELSRRLGWHREQVDRLFRLDHNSRIDQLDAAFKAAGSPLMMNMSDREIMVA